MHQQLIYMYIENTYLCGARDTMAHILHIKQVGTAARAMQLAVWPGSPFLSRHIRDGTEEIKANHKRQAYRNQVCQSRWNSGHVLWEKQIIYFLSGRGHSEYLSLAFSRSEYLFPKSASPPPPPLRIKWSSPYISTKRGKKRKRSDSIL